MDDLRQDSHAQTGLPTEYFACAPSILKHRVSAEVCLLGHQWISRGFTLRKFQYHQYMRSRKIHWTLITQEKREDLQIDFSRATFFGRFLGTLPRNVSIQNSPSPSPPPKKKNIDFFSDWVGLFEICFRSSEMTDPRPCPRRWLYFRVPSPSTKTRQAQTNNKLSAAKRDTFRGQRNITGHHRTFLGKKSICPESSLNNIKAS